MVANTEDDEDSCGSVVNYKAQYRALKRKLKFLIYENECFQETLRSTQRRLLKASRDRSFLLDRLLSFENVEPSSSEGDETESSDDGEAGRPDPKRRKTDYSSSHGGSSNSAGFSKTPPSAKKKRPSMPKGLKLQPHTQVQRIQPSSFSDGHMTAEEVERHLETKQYLDPLISESNELCKMEASPSNLTEDCLGVDM